MVVKMVKEERSLEQMKLFGKDLRFHLKKIKKN